MLRLSTEAKFIFKSAGQKDQVFNNQSVEKQVLSRVHDSDSSIEEGLSYRRFFTTDDFAELNEDVNIVQISQKVDFTRSANVTHPSKIHPDKVGENDSIISIEHFITLISNAERFALDNRILAERKTSQRNVRQTIKENFLRKLEEGENSTIKKPNEPIGFLSTEGNNTIQNVVKKESTVIKRESRRMSYVDFKNQLQREKEIKPLDKSEENEKGDTKKARRQSIAIKELFQVQDNKLDKQHFSKVDKKPVEKLAIFDIQDTYANRLHKAILSSKEITTQGSLNLTTKLSSKMKINFHAKSLSSKDEKLFSKKINKKVDIKKININKLDDGASRQIISLLKSYEKIEEVSIDNKKTFFSPKLVKPNLPLLTSPTNNVKKAMPISKHINYSSKLLKQSLKKSEMRRKLNLLSISSTKHEKSFNIPTAANLKQSLRKKVLVVNN